MPGRGKDIHMDDKPINHVDGVHVAPRGLQKVPHCRSTLSASLEAKLQGGGHPWSCA